MTAVPRNFTAQLAHVLLGCDLQPYAFIHCEARALACAQSSWESAYPVYAHAHLLMRRMQTVPVTGWRAVVARHSLEAARGQRMYVWAPRAPPCSVGGKTPLRCLG